ncbi:uncharacterized protein LOC123877535 [Maniola jurtina]|uniref:uncharacterized protein LOC123877535 n=1 Tax=Maniola jurtina TaxID=191418 RepID=UPI001E68B1D3|nr:uncharacterized protein LOC123877535 [Maniola jurtina]
MKSDPLIVAIISLILMLIPETATADHRSKRSNVENFNVLLSIYKMNPLKHSNVFKTFSNHILLPGPDERRSALNFNINESHESREKNSTNTKSKNEALINHATHKPNDRPLCIKEGTPEKFEPGHFLSKLVSINEIDLDLKENDDSDIFNDGLVQSNITQSKQFSNDVNKLENNPNRKDVEKIAEINESSKVLSNVTDNVAYVDETIVLK